MSIGFIGCGNMASAIISGTINANALVGGDIFAYDKNTYKTDELREKFGIGVCESEMEIAEKSDIVVLAVKPNGLSDVLKKIDGVIGGTDKLIISIAAGKSTDYIRSCVSQDCKIIRVMPNINIKVAESCSAYCSNALVSDKDKKETERIFGAVGTITELDESAFPLFGVIGGCAPAFAYMFIDALARAGVKNGMKKDLALKFAAQTVLGSAKTILESDEHPYELIDKVCSPGGTTIEGVTSLQKDGFETAVHNAVDKSLEKDKKL